MKRIVNSAQMSAPEKVDKLLKFILEENGNDEHDVFMYFLDMLLSSESIKLLESYAEMSDIDLEESGLY